MKSPPATLLRTSAVSQRYSLSPRTIYRYTRVEAEFPQPIRVNSRTLLYSAAELDAFFQARRATTHGEK
ncbi:helix-turn-helix transcriptional regulator [Comamonas sp. J-3]|uniref:helix-turn-helix transcriptional regulator n=1 Tax=Comamonas trifloxystrobinivorans TaxID=3350256 RepID=UPI003728A865